MRARDRIRQAKRLVEHLDAAIENLHSAKVLMLPHVSKHVLPDPGPLSNVALRTLEEARLSLDLGPFYSARHLAREVAELVKGKNS